MPRNLRLFFALISDSIRVLIPFILLGAVFFYIAWQFVEPAPPSRFTLATGGSGGAYEQTGQRYAKSFADSGFELELINTAGSVDNWQRLLNGEVDAALVQSGTLPEGDALPLEAVVSVALEPLFVFYRPEAVNLSDTQELARLDQLSGLKVAIGGEGSGTRKLVTALLEEAGLLDIALDNDLLLEQGGQQAMVLLQAGEIDAAAFVMAPDAPLMTELLSDPSLQVMNFSRAQALARRLPYLTGVTLYQGVVDLNANLPATDIQLIAPATYIAIRNDVHRSMVQLLIEAAKQDQGRINLITDNNQFPSLEQTDITISTDAQYYLERGPNILHRHLPFWLASLVDRLAILIIPLLAIMIPLMRVAPPAFRWRIRRRIYRWYKKLRIIDDDLAKPDVPLTLLQSDLELVRSFENDVADTVVPLSYMEEFYNLRLHVAYIRSRLEERIAALS
ncbi:TAXI family TRAP transporter solute-binding subunit [Nitrincola iocasae]|uniref:C4-dicarboxylate ABC transporter substrate-binding protein n=1 Tax=Nitrincola iocasae TaxID=2614693 RepID=A0A5J6L9Y6_9GAMM|nr:TAXI family TRAP transporter solute-binding subunit [Nitrincola iocasae]QEW05317.1 C4-dicarboxylate ABC transporter substrate-binding protein [Nitrincola iocasae]